MHRFGKLLVAGFLAVFLAAPVSSGADKPVYKQARAKLVRPRGGMPNVLAKLNAGKEVAVGYLGGSITAQAGWRVMTLKWFQNTYPKAKVREINAAIGGTPCGLGVFRLQQDVLRHKPDLVFVEFAVNDGGTRAEDIWRAMEGIVRQIWTHDPTIDICYVYTIYTRGMPNDYAKGLCPRSVSAMEMIADHYSIPSINMGMRVVQLEQSGKLIYKLPKETPSPEGKIVFARDDCHPLPAGHKVYTDVITKAIVSMKSPAQPGPHAIRSPFIDDHWQAAKIVPLKKTMLTGGWKELTKDKGLGRRFAKYMPELWEATKPGEKITFRFRGSKVLLYDLLGPDGGQAIITVDGKRRDKPAKRFDSFCTYHRIATLNIADKLAPDKVHTVEIEIHPDQPDRSAVTNREKSKKHFDPKRYEGTAMRVAGVMIIGEIVEDR
ncbi:MAG: SGNH/GDSL hydrolase family protein [Phycisphaerae bacterium]|jgi:lysophospholipase L1-like esterase|nr:SGNH/GDSL hydrolase family protein [Phycisphaerae bacterium]